MPRIALCLLLLCASASVSARAPMHGSPNDDGCPEMAAAVAAADARSNKARVTPVPATTRKTSKPAARGGGDGDSGSRLPAPRWHSFLPGMFR